MEIYKRVENVIIINQAKIDLCEVSDLNSTKLNKNQSSG